MYEVSCVEGVRFFEILQLLLECLGVRAIHQLAVHRRELGQRLRQLQQVGRGNGAKRSPQKLVYRGGLNQILLQQRFGRPADLFTIRITRVVERVVDRQRVERRKKGLIAVLIVVRTVKERLEGILRGAGRQVVQEVENRQLLGKPYLETG
jgi:hypothetical protein